MFNDYEAVRDVTNVLVSITISILASSGFWAYLVSKRDKKNMQVELLLGLAHDRILYLCMKYIERGYITQDEYENLNTYLYKPYSDLGGNGSVERIMTEVDKLPIRKTITN